MRRRRRTLYEDPELVELLREEPELFPIADAIRETQRPLWRRRQARRLAPPLLGGGAVLAAALTLALVIPWRDAELGIVDEALAAIPARGPVVHVIVRARTFDRTLVEVKSQREVPSITEVELWFDERSQRLHTKVRRDGALTADILESPTGAVSEAGPVRRARGSVPVSPAVAVFATGYRRALASERARVVGEAVYSGRPVYWLKVTTPNGASERVAIDRRTFRPLAFQLLGRDEQAERVTWDVVAIETLARADANLRRPRAMPPAPSGGRIVSARSVSPAEAQTALSRPALWAGRKVSGLPLRGIKLESTSRVYPPNANRSPGRGLGLALLYGDVKAGRPDRKGTFLQVQQAPAPEPAYGFLSGALRIEPPPPPGHLQLSHHPGAEVELWTGRLWHRGLYVTLSASSRELVLAGARSLRPIPTRPR